MLLARANGQKINEIHIDYGRVGKPKFQVETDLISLTCNADIEYGVIQGKFKYNIIVADFVNEDDFNKFRASEFIECQATRDMILRLYQESHGTIFLSLAESDVIAKFTDTYGRTAQNSFSENLDKETRKTRKK